MLEGGGFRISCFCTPFLPFRHNKDPYLIFAARTIGLVGSPRSHAAGSAGRKIGSNGEGFDSFFFRNLKKIYSMPFNEPFVGLCFFRETN